jgi:hypothetical protein
MPRDSNGNASTDPVYVATPGTTIRAVQHNTPIADIIQMLTGSLARNGTGGMLADLAMGGFKITGLADGASAQDAVTKAQLDATLDDLPQLGAWTNVASASTVNLGAQASRNLVITGTTAITSFGTAGASDNVPYLLRFAADPLITNGANLICKGGADIRAAAGDMAIVVHDSATVWRMVDYIPANEAAYLSQSDWNGGVLTKRAALSPSQLAAVLTARSIALGFAYAEYTTQSSVTAVIPFDNTIPLISEGTEILSISYTPKKVGSTIIVRATAVGSSSSAVAGQATVAMFAESTCIATGKLSQANSYTMDTTALSSKHTPTSLSPVNFSVRAGPGSGTLYLNADYAGVGKWGGAARWTLTVEEYA